MKLTQAEILALKREKKKNDSQSRLDKITQVYSREVLDEQITMVDQSPSLPISAEKADLSAVAFQSKEAHAKEAVRSPQAVEAVVSEIPADLLDELVIPENEAESGSIPSVKVPLAGDVLSWIHTLILSLAITVAFGKWIYGHAHHTFDLEPSNANVWWKKMCRQLDYVSFYH